MFSGFLNQKQRSITLDRDPPGALILLAITMLPLLVGSWLVATPIISHLPHLLQNYSVPVRAQVVESHLEPGSGLPLSGNGNAFVYRYIYQGQLFRASAYRPGGHLDEAVRSHQKGSMLTVYVDPDAPQFSMVWPGLSRAQIGDLALGLALIVIGTSALYWRLSSRAAPAKRCRAPSRRLAQFNALSNERAVPTGALTKTQGNIKR